LVLTAYVQLDLASSASQLPGDQLLTPLTAERQGFSGLSQRLSGARSVGCHTSVGAQLAIDKFTRLRLIICNLILILIVVSGSFARSAGGASDCESLADTGWASSVGWTVNISNPNWCCAIRQKGITCDASGLRVVRLVLPSFNLIGINTRGHRPVIVCF
jgi:hypothetical protein